MKNLKKMLFFLMISSAMTSCFDANNLNISQTENTQQQLSLTNISLKKVLKTDADWKKLLTDNQYFILRQKGTEPSFKNEYYNNHKSGNYFCAACQLPLFSSKTKFESGTGWPSFYAPIQKNRVTEVVDDSNGMVRGEIVCTRCEGHLGHVFNDGPEPTGMRYCMDSGALIFLADKK